jgi:hypothetical protein
MRDDLYKAYFGKRGEMDKEEMENGIRGEGG